jgi:hypothetical protein
MNLQLLQGEFSSNDAIDLISKMIQLKISYHENKISNTDSEEDIKFRESKIKRLQKELYEFKNSISENKEKLTLNATIKIDK